MFNYIILKGMVKLMGKQSKKKENNYRPFDFALFIIVLLLLGLGIIMVLSASSPLALSQSASSYTYVISQIKAAILGLIAMIVIAKIDYKIYARFYKLAYFGSIVILLLVLVPNLGFAVNGARRWIKIPIFGSLQPSEVAKLGLIVFFSAYLTKTKDDLKGLLKGFIRPLGFLAIPIAVILFVQSHLSASVIIIITVSLMMLMAGCKFLHFAIFGGAGVVAGGGLLYVLAKNFGIGAYRLTRIMAFLNPWADPTDTGWQIIQGLYAIGSGGLFGVGLGNSNQKYQYISMPHNDYIFAVLAEELGFVGCVIVILLFSAFIWRGIIIAMKAPDMFGSLLATGITALIGSQAIINIAVVTSSMPVTGISLPFFSYGGSSLVILLSLVGVLLNISRQTNKI